jgi:hypothetical protein
MPPAKSFGSNAGRETIASTSPLCTSSATTAPTRACSSGVSGTNAASAACCRSRSSVSWTVPPGTGSISSTMPTTRPATSTIWFTPPARPRSACCSSPSMPACPITSPC